MFRWLLTAAIVVAATAPLMAQVPTMPGYLVIKIKVAGSASVNGEPGAVGAPPVIAPPMPQPGGGVGQIGPPLSPDDKFVIGVIPYKKIDKRLVYPTRPKARDNPYWDWGLYTDTGSSLLFQDKSAYQLYPIRGTYENDLKVKHPRAIGDPRLEVHLDLIAEALDTGNVKLAQEYADELVKRPIKQDPPAKVTEFLRIYNEFKTLAAETLPANPTAVKWKERLAAAATSDTTHYTLIHWGAQSVSDVTLNHRLDLLEKNFTAFYMWHALAGSAPKLPSQKQLVVLANRASDLEQLQTRVDGKPIAADSFYSSEHGMLVFAPERRDPLAATFTGVTRTMFQDGWSRDELTQGKAPVIVNTRTYQDIARMMTLAITDKAFIEEGEIAAVTRLGNRQLFTASGLLAQHVIMPEWVETGASTVLQKPVSPGAIDLPNNRRSILLGLHGNTAANFLLLRQFREMVAKSDLNPNADEVLLSTLQDRYFEAVRTGRDIDPQVGGDKPGVIPGGGIIPGQPGGGVRPPGGIGFPPPPGGFPGGPPGGFPGGPPGGRPDPAIAEAAALKAKLESKAETTAWALTYYLSKTKMANLHAYYAELNRLPRDLRIDKTVSMQTFCQAFNLLAVDQKTPDPTAIKDFAAKWYTFMKSTPATWYEVAIESAITDPGAGQALDLFVPRVPGGGR